MSKASVAPYQLPAVPEDSPDPPGEEMSKDARVWKTYVREADRWDKEMIDGRNNSLDVLLIFAALFSAISTALITESLHDLKPDPTESSAQTLLLVSRTLTALANGQPSPPPVEIDPNTAAFSPSRSAVIVNTLWLLSLSLSVAVSLIAILAKDWCYKFMSGRSGQAYEQARRRQQKWDGMERWKMALILQYLPGVMHLALLLFAVGLCVYLWDINVSVAMPVLVVTVLAFLAYGFSTIVPLFAQFCPYSTPVATAIVDLRKSIPLVAYSISHYLYWHISYPKWLELTLERIKDWLNPDNARREDGIETNESNRAPADITTSQMIAWMITNCEDSHSVDIALQALAGAHDGLPRAPLEQCDALSRIVSRLKQGCALFEPTLQDPSVQQLAAISTASKYLRASINCLYGSGSVPADFDRWSSYVESSMRSNLRNWDYYRLRPSCTKILTLSRHRIENAGVLAVAASMSFCHLQGPYSSRGRDGERLATAISDVLGHVTSALNSHFQEGGVALATTGLHALVKSSVHYLVGCWPREWKYRRRGSLPVLLARVFVACYDTAPDTARAAAVALVAGAFASYTYPGGREPTPNVDAREKRAVQVLQYYQANKPDTEQLFALYIFGFYSWLPWVTSDYQNEQLTGIIRDLGPITRGDHYELGAILRKQIQTMPYQFSLLEFAIKTVSTCVSSTTNNTRSRTSAITTSLLLFYTPPDFDQLHIGLYLVALVSLCHAKSDDHQNLCMQVIAKQGLPDAPLQELNSVDGKKLLQQLCCTLFSKNTAVLPFAAVHFGLLVAHIATNEQGSLEDRQSTLRPLLSLQDWSGELQDHSAVKLSDLVSHLEEIIVNHSTVNGLQRTMQFITSFCNTSLDTDLDLSPSSGAPTNWQEKLEKLKWSYQPTLEELDSLYAKYEDDFISNLPQLAEEESVLASGTTEIMTQRARQAEIVDQDTSWGFEGPFGAR